MQSLVNHTTQVNPFIQGKISLIMNLDLSKVSRKIMSEEGQGWDIETTQRVEQLYREYLTIALLNPGKISPTGEVDKYWHQHILDTRQYMDDCKAIFGQYLHHDPNMGMDGDRTELEAIFEETNKLFIAQFGHPQGRKVETCSGGGCSNCCSKIQLEAVGDCSASCCGHGCPAKAKEVGECTGGTCAKCNSGMLEEVQLTEVADYSGGCPVSKPSLNGVAACSSSCSGDSYCTGDLHC